MFTFNLMTFTFKVLLLSSLLDSVCCVGWTWTIKKAFPFFSQIASFVSVRWEYWNLFHTFAVYKVVIARSLFGVWWSYISWQMPLNTIEKEGQTFTDKYDETRWEMDSFYEYNSSSIFILLWGSMEFLWKYIPYVVLMSCVICLRDTKHTVYISFVFPPEKKPTNDVVYCYILSYIYARLNSIM